MKEGQISVIIPIYNVEEYLQQSVESVINQTYKNLQIILIDDGSTDKSGQLCDGFEKEDNRIEVIHKDNGGLSDARNVGLALATGEYIFYLDSDDYLNINSLEYMMNIQRMIDADIVISNYYYTYSDYEVKAECSYGELSVLDNFEAMEGLVTGKIPNFAWGKLIKRQIAVKYLFPKGKLFEDNYWAHLVFAEMQRVVVINEPLLHYRQRNTSISYTFTAKRLDILEGWRERRDFLAERYPELLPKYLKHLADNYINIAWLILTKMKRERYNAFRILKEFNRNFKLQDYAEGTTKKLICKLDKGMWIYCISAIYNRLKRG